MIIKTSAEVIHYKLNKLDVKSWNFCLLSKGSKAGCFSSESYPSMKVSGSRCRLFPPSKRIWSFAVLASSLRAGAGLRVGIWALQTSPLGDFSAFPQVRQVSLCSLSGAEAGSSATWNLESLIQLFAVSSFIAGNRSLREIAPYRQLYWNGRLFKEEKSEYSSQGY